MSADDKSVCSVALKEWAVVVEALLAGKQIVLLRKGGISEEEGAFRPRARRFWLFPTWEHQSAMQIQASYRDLFAESVKAEQKTGKVLLSCYAETTDVAIIPTRETLERMAPATIWEKSYFDTRWNYKPEKPLFALFLRVFQIKPPHEIPLHPDYAGCKSWVPLKESLWARTATPVFSQDDYDRQKKTLIARLHEKT